MANDIQVHWLTQDSYDRLMAEKEALIANRPVIAAEINERREEGDLKENAGYHAAREQQGQEEARIRTIDDLLANAQVGETPTESGVALIGLQSQPLETDEEGHGEDTRLPPLVIGLLGTGDDDPPEALHAAEVVDSVRAGDDTADGCRSRQRREPHLP